MSYLTERAAYIKGLMKGTDLDFNTKEGKILQAVVELLSDMADEIGEAYESIYDLQDQVDELDDVLHDVEEEICGECDCADCDDEDDDEDDDWDFDDDDELALECPHCGDTIYLDPSLLENSENSITCPNCKEEIEIEFSDDCDCHDHE